MIKISACWIVKNEASNIALSLNSVKNSVDEMIVVDTGSTDGTVNIAEQCGAKVEHFTWINDFAAAKNYALSLAKGDVVIFIDGDEYFEPALTEENKEEIYNIFQTSETDILHVNRAEIDVDSDSFLAMLPYERIFRRSTIEYENKIHENPIRKDGKLPASYALQGITLMHTGYSKKRVKEKAARNVEILESEQNNLQDGFKLFLNNSYLLREYIVIGNFDKAISMCYYFMNHPEFLEKASQAFPIGFLERSYNAVNLAITFRPRFRRADLYNKVILQLKKNYPGSRESVITDLYYQINFEFQKNTFLKNLKEMDEQSDRLPPSFVSECNEAQSLLYGAGAVAMWHRKDMKQAEYYATKALKDAVAINSYAVQIFIHFLRDLPLEEAIHKIDHTLNFSYNGVLDILLDNLKFDGLRELYMHYQKKRMDQGNAPFGPQLYYLLLQGKTEASVNQALEFLNENNRETVAEHLLLAAICADDRTLWDNHLLLLEKYNPILKAYFQSLPLENPCSEDVAVLQKLYHLVHFAAGEEIAGQFSRVFSARPKDVFLVKEKYYSPSLQHEKIINDADYSLLIQDLECATLIVRASIILGKYDRAYQIISMYLDQEILDNNLLEFLLIISEKADPPLAGQARDQHRAALDIFNDYIDLNDMISTGTVTDTGRQKQIEEMKNLTYRQLMSIFREKRQTPAPDIILRMHSQVGELYKANDLPLDEMQSYILLIAKDYEKEENLASLIELCEKYNHKALAGEIRQYRFT